MEYDDSIIVFHRGRIATEPLENLIIGTHRVL